MRHPLQLLLPCLLVLPVIAPAAELSTQQRLELLERRVSRITELTLQLDEMRRENRQLRGEIENLGYEIEQLKRKQRDIYLDIDQRLGAVQGADGSVPGEGAAAPAEDAGRAAPAVVESRSVAAANVDRAKIQAEYQAAFELLSPRQKRYAESARAFSAFLEKYPNDELAPNAQYWLGEAYYVSQQNAPALEAFGLVVSRYPDSTKVPGALFKIGLLHQAAGDRDAARASFERVLKDFPNSPAAGLSRKRLSQLGN